MKFHKKKIQLFFFQSVNLLQDIEAKKQLVNQQSQYQLKPEQDEIAEDLEISQTTNKVKIKYFFL